MPDAGEGIDSPSTPLMRQYHAVKQQVPNVLLMFRLGDFYELFYEDAITAARELEITLTARNKEKGQPIPMCGVPYHAAEGYLSRLIQKGYRVAICDQMEEAGPGKKLVRREVTRVVTPGTATEASLLRSHENNYLASVFRNGSRAGLAHADITTGEFRATEIDAADVNATLENLNVREVLAPESINSMPGLRTVIEDWVFGLDHADRALREHFRLLALDGCGLNDRPLAVSAAGAILHYLRETQKSALDHLDRPTYYDRSDSMILDAVTVRNLELLEPLFAGETQGIDVDPCARSNLHRDGRPAAAQSAAAPVSADRRDRSAPGCRSGDITGHDCALRDPQAVGSSVGPGTIVGQVDVGNGRPARVAGTGAIAGTRAWDQRAHFRISKKPGCAIFQARSTRFPSCATAFSARSRKSRPPTWLMVARFAPAIMANLTSCAISAAIAASTSPKSRHASAAGAVSSR